MRTRHFTLPIRDPDTAHLRPPRPAAGRPRPAAARRLARSALLAVLTLAGIAACAVPPGLSRPSPSMLATPAPHGGLSIATVPLERRTPAPTREPLPAQTPRPTPLSTPKATPPAPGGTAGPAKRLPAVIQFDADFFGAGVTLETFPVTGRDPAEILASIAEEGPVIPWTGRAQAVTTPDLRFRFGTSTDEDGVCTLEIRKRPPITLVATVLLPAWTPPEGATAKTVRWWNRELELTAIHERVHVRHWVKAVRRMNAAFDKATCTTVHARLDRIAAETRRQDCEFDMDEYGREAGLSLAACLAP